MTSFDYARLVRLLNFVISNIVGIAVPMAIYSLTGKLHYAGLALLIEWCPKIGLYLYLGDFVEKHNEHSVHLSMDYIRVICLGIGILAVLQVVPWYCVLAVSMSNQMNAAIFNVLYELNTSRWIKCAPTGHASFLKIDNIAGLVGMAICIGVSNLTYLLEIALGLALTSIFLLYRAKPFLYCASIRNDNPAHKSIQWNRPLASLQKMTPSLWWSTMLGFSISLPVAVLFSMMPFFLEYAMNRPTSTSEFSFINFIRIALGILVLQLVIHGLPKYSAWRIFKWLSAVCVLSLLALSMLKGYSYVAALMLFGASCIGMYPWLRAERQTLMQRKEASSLTGLVIALQSTSYLAAGMLTASGLSPINLTLLVTTLSILLYLLSLYMYRRQSNRALLES